MAAADRLLVSKPDRVAKTERAALSQRLQTLNPVATVGTSRFGDAAMNDLFGPASWRTPAKRWAEPVGLPGHADAVTCITLTCDQPLDWRSLQRWLAALLAASGDSLLRLKGILDIAGSALPVVLQAVHHTVYPIEILTRWPAARSSVLVLIADHPLSPDLQPNFEGCAMTR